MAADESLRFDIVGDDHASDAFSKVGRSVGDMSGKMDHAASASAYLDDALKRQRGSDGQPYPRQNVSERTLSRSVETRETDQERLRTEPDCKLPGTN